MAYNKLSSYKTTWADLPNNGVTVTYQQTEIVRNEGNKITLRSGGWETVTTKRKMNQASHQFALGYSVYQRDYSWYVDLPNGETVPFEDGMTFDRYQHDKAS